MKHRLFLIIATLAALSSTLTSCFWDDELVVAPNDGDPKTPISFNVNIGSLPDPEVTTRTDNTLARNVSGITRGAAQTDGTAYEFAANDLVKIGIKAPTSPTYPTSRSTTEEVKTYKVSSTNSTTHKSELVYNGATATDRFQWLSKTEDVLLRAWSFGNTSTPTDPQSYVTAAPFVLTTNQSSGYNEVFYSPETTYSYTTNSGDIEIPLYHQLARVMITVTEDGGSTSEKTVTIGDGTMKLPKTATFADPDPASDLYGTWTIKDATEAETITPFTETTNQKYSAVLIPGTYAAGGNFINITIGTSPNDETFHYNIPTGGITLLAGKQYNYNITIKNRAITFTVTVTDWTSDPRTIDFSE